jgi:hypothetical protein
MTLSVQAVGLIPFAPFSRGNVPPFLRAKPAKTPEKTSNRRDFVRSGALYLVKTPCFPAFFTSKEPANGSSFNTCLAGSNNPRKHRRTDDQAGHSRA